MRLFCKCMIALFMGQSEYLFYGVVCDLPYHVETNVCESIVLLCMKVSLVCSYCGEFAS